MLSVRFFHSVSLRKFFAAHVYEWTCLRLIQGKEPDVTNIDESVVDENQDGLYSGCLDYIWYTPGKLVPAAVLDIPDDEVLRLHQGLPSIVFPSDHLPLYAQFQLLHWVD